MGECGCSEPNYLRRFPGPDGLVYALEIYPGCPYCHTPVGITIYCLNQEEQNANWGEDEEGPPELEWMEISDGYAMAAIAVLDPDILKKVALKYVDSDGERFLIEDALEEAHIEAVETTVAVWEARA